MDWLMRTLLPDSYRTASSFANADKVSSGVIVQ